MFSSLFIFFAELLMYRTDPEGMGQIITVIFLP